jgi:hypothetical protein
VGAVHRMMSMSLSKLSEDCRVIGVEVVERKDRGGRCGHVLGRTTSQEVSCERSPAPAPFSPAGPDLGARCEAGIGMALG